MKLQKNEVRMIDGKAVPFIMMYEDIRIQLCKDVGLSSAMVYYAIRGFKMSFDNMHCCYPSNSQIAEVCGLKSTSGIQKHLNTLKDKGWLKWNSGGKDKKQNSTYYFPKEEYLYTDEELHYIAKVESITYDIDKTTAKRTKKNSKVVEEIKENETFTPVGKYVGDDLFDEEIEELPPSNNIDTSVGYMEEFYINMHNYYNVNDESLKNNNTIIKKVNDLVGFINTELTNNNIENIKAEKIINDIMKNNQKLFGKGLNKITDDFRKCTYIITCIQNNFTNKKLSALIKSSKDNNYPPIDDGFVDYMNDNFIELSNGERESKKEIIRRMELITNNPKIKEEANKIAREVFKSYNYCFDGWDNCHINIIRDIVKGLEKNLGNGILTDNRFDGIIINDIAI